MYSLKRKGISIILICAVAMLVGFCVEAESLSAPITLEAYKEQVEAQNQSYAAYAQRKDSARLQLRVNDLQLSPNLFSTAQAGWDSKLPSTSLMSYDRLDTRNYSVGLQQNTRYGTDLTLSYDVDYTNYINMSGGPVKYYDARPVLEFSQQLWRNGFGKSTQASLNATEAKWLAEVYTAEAGMSVISLNAEIAYWNLVIAREVVKIQGKSLQQSQAIFDYVSGMAKKNLYEQSDVIQARASLESSRLALQTAKNDERAAGRNFNALRNKEPNAPIEELSAIDWLSLEAVFTSSAHRAKAEVKAAEYQAKSTAEQTKVSIDQNEPSLELLGSYALNGRDTTFPDTAADSLGSGRPTRTIGLKFSMPLNGSAVADVKKGLEKQNQASSLSYKQKLADQEQEWADLSAKLADACEQLRMTKEIEKIQNEKLANERLRLQQGRTTTYQVLQFEQDYLQSELSYVRAALTALTLRAQTAIFQY